MVFRMNVLLCLNTENLLSTSAEISSYFKYFMMLNYFRDRNKLLIIRFFSFNSSKNETVLIHFPISSVELRY